VVWTAPVRADFPPDCLIGRNLVPNATFDGSGGLRVGAATGQVPDGWRAFAHGGGAADVTTVSLPADALYPGSPPTRAVKLRVTTFGTDQGFDHDNTRFAIIPGASYRAGFYAKTGNSDATDQHFARGFPLFDANGYLGREPGGRGNNLATSTWTWFAGPEFDDDEAIEAHISFRLTDDGGEDAILIALPAVEQPSLAGDFTPPSPADLAQRTCWSPTDKLIGTTYFYWYRFPDLHFYDDPGHTDDALTDHFVSPETVSMESRCWHKKEITDMIDAGIDMVWPVYWAAPGNFDHPSLRLFVEGLVPLQAAIEELADEGFDPPKVGMFYDTSSLLNSVRQQSPPDGKADLTTPEGKAILYETIRSFFATVHPRHWACIDGRPIVVLYASVFAEDYDQSAFTYVDTQFAAEFGGVTPYIIREMSWNVSTDSSYRWGAALNGPQLDGIAAIGPGYDDSAVPDRTTPVRLRENGDFYRASWQQVIESDRTIVHVETWNEMHEGSEICESVEWGREYIDLTAEYAAHFKNGTVPSTMHVMSVDPAHQAVLGGTPVTIVATFDVSAEGGSVNNSTFRVVGSGGDGVFGNGNDVTVTPSSIRAWPFSPPRAILGLVDIALPNDVYTVRLIGTGGDPIRDSHGLLLDGEFDGSFPSGDGITGGDFVSHFTIDRLPGDFDSDSDADYDDYLIFASCFTGPGGTVNGVCAYADSDGDGDVDCLDWSQFQLDWTEPNRPPELPQCLTPVPILTGGSRLALSLLLAAAAVGVLRHRRALTTRGA